MELPPARRLPATVLHPGHLVGSGWPPINPAGNFNPGVFANLRGGRSVRLPNFGLETLHHVHADDVAQEDYLILESSFPVRIPARYLNAEGQIRMGAPYSERDFHAPSELVSKSP